MFAKYFSIVQKYVLSVSSQIKHTFYHQNTLLDAFRTNSRNIIGRNPSMVISLLAHQDLTPILFATVHRKSALGYVVKIVAILVFSMTCTNGEEWSDSGGSALLSAI